MDVKVLTGSSYEDAVQKACAAYGDRVRILRRRDIARKGFLGLGRAAQCEIVFHLADSPARPSGGPPSPQPGPREAEDSARAAVRSEVCSYSEFFEDSDRQRNRLFEEERILLDGGGGQDEAPPKALEPYLRKTREIMAANGFDPRYAANLCDEVRKQLCKGLPALPTDRDFEILLLDNIASSFESDHGTQLYPPRFFVLAGGKGVGKTATAWKIGNVYASGLGRSVEVVRLTEGGPGPSGSKVQTDPNGVRHSVHSCQEDLGALAAKGPDDICIIDSFCPPQGDERSKGLLFDFYRRLPRGEAKFFLVMEASTTCREAERLLGFFEKTAFQSIVLTKCDADGAMGPAISVSSRFGLPLLFICDGSDLSGNIGFATSLAVISKLKGFSLDLDALSQRG